MEKLAFHKTGQKLVEVIGRSLQHRYLERFRSRVNFSRDRTINNHINIQKDRIQS